MPIVVPARFHFDLRRRARRRSVLLVDERRERLTSHALLDASAPLLRLRAPRIGGAMPATAFLHAVPKTPVKRCAEGIPHLSDVDHRSGSLHSLQEVGSLISRCRTASAIVILWRA